MKLPQSAQNTTNTFRKCTIKFLVVQYLKADRKQEHMYCYLKCAKANILLAEFGRNGKKQNMISVTGIKLLANIYCTKF
jgi:hypothetical protein